MLALSRSSRVALRSADVVSVPSRGFAASPDPTQQIRIRLAGQSGQLAKKLFVGASANKATTDVEKDARAVLKVLENFPQLEKYFRLPSPLFANKPNLSKSALVESIAKEGKVSKTTADFLKALATKQNEKDLVILGSILNDYLRIMKDVKREVDCTIISAKDLTSKETDGVMSFLKKQFPGDTILAKKQSDPSLIAGYVVQVGDVTFDRSAKRQIEEQYQKILQGVRAYGDSLG